MKQAPNNFTEWVKANKDRIKVAQKKGSLPYFLRDNRRLLAKEMGEKDYSYKYGKGSVTIDIRVNPKDADYQKLENIALQFANMGSFVRLTPKMTRPSKFKYEEVYQSLIGTKYEGKCPDLNIDGEWYEYESFVSDNPKNAFRNMLNDGLKQSDKLILDKPNLTDAYMKRVIWQRIKSGQSIKEVWLLEDGKKRLCIKVRGVITYSSFWREIGSR